MMSDNQREDVPVEEVLLSQIYTVQALINVLEKKELLTREEILEEFEAIKETLADECDCDDGEHIN
jgi:translation elongation factor EF-Tu-like GTPase